MGFTVMPFKGFLGPSWESAALTRILRHYRTDYIMLFMNIQVALYEENVKTLPNRWLFFFAFQKLYRTCALRVMSPKGE